jgi:hypothetical protein
MTAISLQTRSRLDGLTYMEQGIGKSKQPLPEMTGFVCFAGTAPDLGHLYFVGSILRASLKRLT